MSGRDLGWVLHGFAPWVLLVLNYSSPFKKNSLMICCGWFMVDNLSFLLLNLRIEFGYLNLWFDSRLSFNWNLRIEFGLLRISGFIQGRVLIEIWEFEFFHWEFLTLGLFWLKGIFFIILHHPKNLKNNFLSIFMYTTKYCKMKIFYVTLEIFYIKTNGP